MPKEKSSIISLSSLQGPLTQALSVFAHEFLAPNADIPSLALAPCDSAYRLPRHTKLEWNMSGNSAKKIGNIRSFGFALKNVSFFTDDVF